MPHPPPTARPATSRARVPVLTLTACLAVSVGCAPLGRIPETDYQTLGRDEHLATKSGPAAELVELPRFKSLADTIASSHTVVRLNSPNLLNNNELTVGPLPEGSVIGFSANGYPQWFALGGEALVLGRTLPKGSLVVYEGYAIRRTILGSHVRYGPLDLEAGDEVLVWRANEPLPMTVRLNGPRMFGGKNYGDADEVSFRPSGEVAGVFTEKQAGQAAAKANAELERKRQARETACAFKCAGESGINKSDCERRCMF